MRRASLIHLAFVLALALPGTGCGEDVPTAPDIDALVARLLDEERRGNASGLDRAILDWQAQPADRRAHPRAGRVRSAILRRNVAIGSLPEIQAAWDAVQTADDGRMWAPNEHEVEAGIAALWLRDEILAQLEADHEAGSVGADDARLAFAARVDERVHEEEREAFTSTERWLGFHDVDSLPLATPVPQGARVLVMADAFALQEELLYRVLARWRDTYGDEELDIQVMYVDRGHVRRGLRRVPWPDADQRAEAVRAHCDAHGFDLVLVEGREDVIAMFGLTDALNGMMLIDADGRIVARQRARLLSPGALEPALVRMMTR